MHIALDLTSGMAMEKSGSASEATVKSKTIISDGWPIVESVVMASKRSPMEKATERTAVLVVIVRKHFPVFTSHNLTELSAEPVATNFESEETSKVHTAPVWPFKVPRRSPFALHHTLTVGSFDAVKSKSPSPLYFTLVSGRVCACKRMGIIFLLSLLIQPLQTFFLSFFKVRSVPEMSTRHHPDLIICRKQPGAAVGKLCNRCDGRCPVCDSHVRPTVPVRICDECNFGTNEGRCIICGHPGSCDAFYCWECAILEKDREGCPKAINISSARMDYLYERKRG